MLTIQYTGHGLEVTQALKEFTESKFDKVQRHHDSISRLKITLGVEHLSQIAEASLVIEGTEIHAKASSEDMYHSIDELSHKVNRQLDKYKGKHV